MVRMMLVSIAVICSVSCSFGGVYEPIGSGGPGGEDSKYSLIPGLPGPTILDEVYLEGHIFEFKGHITFDKYTYWFEDPARILVRNFTDLSCIRSRQNPTTCDVVDGAYLVTRKGDLIYIQGVTIRPDNDKAVPAWQYLGTGYLTVESSDSDTTSSGLSIGASNLEDSIANLIEIARELDEGIGASISNLSDLQADMNAPNATIDANLIGKVDNLSKNQEYLEGISERLMEDLEQAESASEALTAGIEGLETDLIATSTELARVLNEATPECRYELKWPEPVKRTCL